MELDEILKVGIGRGASDVHFKVGLPPILRINEALVPLKEAPHCSGEELSGMLFGMMSDAHKKKFRETHELDISYGVKGLGRFRVNVFQQRGTIGAVLRVIPFNIKATHELHLPDVITKLAEEQGMRNLRRDGIQKIFFGLTDLLQVNKVSA